MPTTVPRSVLLPEQEWQQRRRAHEQRVEQWTVPHLERRRRGQRHPVEDFLWDYYHLRPAQLRAWHPGVGAVLTGESAASFVATGRYEPIDVGVQLRAEVVERLASTAAFVASLQRAILRRAEQHGCFGLHEWAMVYRSTPGEPRHASFPLRLGHDGTDRVVESQRLRCTHYDAFRFFTGPARPRNSHAPTLDRRMTLEQGDCLHVNMDLYKWSARLLPAVPSELVADCFALAREIRILDMRASPYDLSGLGYQPVPIETADGRAEYVAGQRAFADRARALRERLVAACERIVDHIPPETRRTAPDV